MVRWSDDTPMFHRAGLGINIGTIASLVHGYWDGSSCADGWRVCAGVNLASGVPAHAEPDVFMRVVGFALTGSDHADPKMIGDRAKCVFAIKNDILHLNNVHTDRIAIHRWQRQQGLEQWVTVELHGDDVVFEETTEPTEG
jgi:hypothetical protein